MLIFTDGFSFVSLNRVYRRQWESQNELRIILQLYDIFRVSPALCFTLLARTQGLERTGSGNIGLAALQEIDQLVSFRLRTHYYLTNIRNYRHIVFLPKKDKAYLRKKPRPRQSSLARVMQATNPTLGNLFGSDIQNDLLDSISEVYVAQIELEISSCEFVSIQSDEATDVRCASQLAVVLRYVKCGRPVERFHSFVNVKNRSAVGIFETLWSILRLYNVREN